MVLKIDSKRFCLASFFVINLLFSPGGLTKDLTPERIHQIVTEIDQSSYEDSFKHAVSTLLKPTTRGSQEQVMAASQSLAAYPFEETLHLITYRLQLESEREKPNSKV